MWALTTVGIDPIGDKPMQAILILSLVMLLSGSASATSMPETSVPEPDLRWADEPVPFLREMALRAQSARILPPAPVSGTPRYAADREVFR